MRSSRRTESSTTSSRRVRRHDQPLKVAQDGAAQPAGPSERGGTRGAGARRRGGRLATDGAEAGAPEAADADATPAHEAQLAQHALVLAPVGRAP